MQLTNHIVLASHDLYTVFRDRYIMRKSACTQLFCSFVDSTTASDRMKPELKPRVSSPQLEVDPPPVTQRACDQEKTKLSMEGHESKQSLKWT